MYLTIYRFPLAFRYFLTVVLVTVAAMVFSIGILNSTESELKSGPEPEHLPLEKWLTTEEVAWLKTHDSIRISGPKAFPPFHYFDDEGNVKGISSDYMQFLMERLGVKFQISKNLPWPEVLNRVKTRQLDIIACAAKTVDRETYLNFSDPYLSFPMVIIISYPHTHHRLRIE